MPAKRKATAALGSGTPAPNINVECPNSRCNMYDVEQSVPGGVQLSDTVIATYNLACAVCGTQLVILSST